MVDYIKLVLICRKCDDLVKFGETEAAERGPSSSSLESTGMTTVRYTSQISSILSRGRAYNILHNSVETVHTILCIIQ